MVDISKLIAANTVRWRAMVVHKELIPSVSKVAARLAAPAAKARYVAVTKITKVPWYVIAVIHEREASQSWKANLAQGDRWDRVSIHVPRGRGPFSSWQEAAVDALVNCAPHASRWRDWSIGGALTLLEEYNGLGYASMKVGGSRGRPSPYIWAATNQYTRGKYIADGHYDARIVDHQIGCAAILSRMAAIDTSISLK